MFRSKYFFLNRETLILRMQKSESSPFFRRMQSDLYVFETYRKFLWIGLYPTRRPSHHMRGKIPGLKFVCPALPADQEGTFSS